MTYQQLRVERAQIVHMLSNEHNDPSERISLVLALIEDGDDPPTTEEQMDADGFGTAVAEVVRILRIEPAQDNMDADGFGTAQDHGHRVRIEDDPLGDPAAWTYRNPYP